MALRGRRNGGGGEDELNLKIEKNSFLQCVLQYTVQKGYSFPVPSWDVTNQTGLGIIY